ncbi:MAG: TRAP transporter large permease subunit [Synergistaceae bacterium]|jgi:TRAP-type C4-dicarboxylate transport system permease large subunit|nr:TRAP transporter large permease subunit [Synergistaceae bacterium]
MSLVITVVIPFALLLSVVLIKKIPYIGGNVKWALLVGAVASLLFGGVYSPAKWVMSFIDGLNRLSWVMALAIVGGIYAETQSKIGTMSTVLESCRSAFGRTPKGLICVVMFVLALSGSLLGDAVASSVVIGVLVIKNLDELELTPEQICATIVMGSALGSIMPPISQAVIMASGLVGLDAAGGDSAINWSYITVGVSFVICCVFVCAVFIKVKQIPEDLIPKESAGQILRKNWKSLIPLVVLMLIVIFRSGFGMDVLKYLDPIFLPISKIPVISGLNFAICKALYITLVICLFYKEVRSSFGQIVVKGLKNVMPCVGVQICASFLIGAFYAAGQVEAVKEFASNLDPNSLKIGGAVAMCLMGMVTGSQSSAQSVIFSLFGPALLVAGVPAVNAAVAGAHLAMAGQGMPPADLITFVVAGLVGGVVGKEVDMMKSMIYSSFMCLCFIAVAFIFMYI